MKKLLFILVMALISISLSAQSLRIGAGGGLTQNLNKTNLLADVVTGGELTFGSDYHYGIKAKVGIPLLPLTVVGSWFYNTLKSSSDIAGNTYEVNGNFSTLGLGAEMSFIPGPIKPYLAADLLYTTFGEQKAISNGNTLSTAGKMNRWGLGIGAGLELGFIPKLDIDVMAKYQLNNLMGKDDGEESINTINLSVLVMFNLI